MKKLTVFLLITLLFIPISQAQEINSKKLVYGKFRIIISGKIIPLEPSQNVKIRVFIPQNYSSISVSPETWKIVKDEYGNKMVEIFWKKITSSQKYTIIVTLGSKAFNWKELPKDKDVEVVQYKQLTRNLLPTEEMKLISFGNEDVLEKASRLTFWVHNYLKYDENYSGILRSVKEIYESRRGVCSDYSLLLTSLLRFQEIPTRFVFGLAFNPHKGFVPHSWIEVLYKNKWVPFDPTWLEGIFLDATHIKFATMPIDNFTEVITFKGGKVEWIKEDAKVEILEYKEGNPFVCYFPEEVKMKGNSVYLLNISCKGEGLELLKLISCVDKKGKPVLQIFPTEKFLIVNGSSNFLFAVKSRKLDKKVSLICPVILTDNFGTTKSINFQISDNSDVKEILLEGPSSVVLGKEIKLQLPVEGVLFSANDSMVLKGKEFKLKPKVFGIHVYYFLSQNILGKYKVDVVPKKMFEIVQVLKPSQPRIGEQFNITVTLRNLENMYQNGVVYVKWDGENKTQNLIFKPREIRNITIALAFNSPGKKLIEVGVRDLYPNTYFFEIEVFKQESLEKKAFSFLNKIMEFLKNLFEFIRSVIFTLFSF